MPLLIVLIIEDDKGVALFMKKVVLNVLLASVVASLLITMTACKKTDKDISASYDKSKSPNKVVSTLEAHEKVTENKTHETTTKATTTSTTAGTTSAITSSSTQSHSAAPQKVSLGNSLFIGDSRTVGLAEYSSLIDVDFFANVGMSVYNIYDKSISVPSVGRVTIDSLLNHKKYDKIYLMLGINECGYDIPQTIRKYGDLVSYIQSKQPNAKIFLQANLHVTKERSNRDKSINNPRLNQLNAGIKGYADGRNIFYMDANSLFDDEGGNLSVSKSMDNAHLGAKYYTQWGEWIGQKTASLYKEN